MSRPLYAQAGVVCLCPVCVFRSSVLCQKKNFLPGRDAVRCGALFVGTVKQVSLFTCSIAIGRVAGGEWPAVRDVST